MVLASEPVGGRSRATELPCMLVCKRFCMFICEIVVLCITICHCACKIIYLLHLLYLKHLEIMCIRRYLEQLCSLSTCDIIYKVEIFNFSNKVNNEL